MSENKQKLPEDEGTFFIEIKDALKECCEILDNYEEVKAIEILNKHSQLWVDAHHLYCSSFIDAFDTDGTNLEAFHGKYQDLIFTVEFKNQPINPDEFS